VHQTPQEFYSDNDLIVVQTIGFKVQGLFCQTTIKTGFKIKTFGK
jgi:hypothetical protein